MIWSNAWKRRWPWMALERKPECDDSCKVWPSKDVASTGGICPKSPTNTIPKLPKPSKEGGSSLLKDLWWMLLETCSRRLLIISSWAEPTVEISSIIINLVFDKRSTSSFRRSPSKSSSMLLLANLKTEFIVAAPPPMLAAATPVCATINTESKDLKTARVDSTAHFNVKVLPVPAVPKTSKRSGADTASCCAHDLMVVYTLACVGSSSDTFLLCSAASSKLFWNRSFCCSKLCSNVFWKPSASPLNVCSSSVCTHPSKPMLAASCASIKLLSGAKHL